MAGTGLGPRSLWCILESETMRLIRAFGVLFLALVLTACASSGTRSAGAPPAPTEAAVTTYLIGVDDVVQVSVWRNPDLGITVPVRPDGKISVPLIGDVAAGGRTPAQVGQDIQTKLATYVRDPQVAVILRSEEHTSELQSLM